MYKLIKHFHTIPKQIETNLKIPKHLSINISEEYSKNLNEIRNIIQWSEELNIPMVSIYDKNANIKPNTFKNQFNFQNSSNFFF
jgi:hypothetical protein